MSALKKGATDWLVQTWWLTNWAAAGAGGRDFLQFSHQCMRRVADCLGIIGRNERGKTGVHLVTKNLRGWNHLDTKHHTPNDSAACTGCTSSFDRTGGTSSWCCFLWSSIWADQRWWGFKRPTWVQLLWGAFRENVDIIGHWIYWRFWQVWHPGFAMYIRI